MQKTNSAPTLLLAVSLLAAALIACEVFGVPFGADLAPTDVPAPTAAPTTRILNFFIALDDQGQTGKAVGCGDSVMGVTADIPPTDVPLRAALEMQLAINDQVVQPTGLYNALYQSDLKVDVIEQNAAGVVTVKLSGPTALGGVCDAPRFKAQLEETILQFPGVTGTQIFINDIALDDFLSGK